MDLFNQKFNCDFNILPSNGIVNYYGKVFSRNESDFYFSKLLNSILWKNDEILMFGKKIITSRKVAWYGDEDLSYTYSKVTKTPNSWTPVLMEIKEIVEKKTNETYNSCLLNLYHNGSEGMGWHSDNERELKPNGAICSVSFGENRVFSFKNNVTKETVSIDLESGSLLLMKGETQSYWKHQLPKSKKYNYPRINLTFRTIQK
ncbi:MAG: alpha-ketoglutarate-dependent dioxygenase AlkB [Cytophagales bacterium]|nr:MAG: alpha-ketoglutarate-dependent dioxygenase AlkB [Cytophagales bacterium]